MPFASGRDLLKSGTSNSTDIRHCLLNWPLAVREFGPCTKETPLVCNVISPCPWTSEALSSPNILSG
ncbi:Uncharacterised protein [Vibrio cholerae]|nr:Uncharacterised protein [Vibrio cholerae]